MRFRCVILFILCWGAIPSIVLATPPAREPAAVVYLSSLDGVIDDVDYLVTIGGHPELSRKLKDLITKFNNIEGINRSQPVGVMAFVPLDLAGGDADPELVGFVPITDGELLKKTITFIPALAASASASPNRYELKVSGKNYQARIDQGHLLLAEKGELLDSPLPAPNSLTAPLSGQYDIVVQLRKQGVPKLLWDMAMLGALNASDSTLKELRQSRESADLLKVRAIEIARRALVAGMTEVRSVWLGLRVSREARNALLDLKFEFSDSGKVVQTLNGMASGAVAFSDVAGAQTPAGFHFQLAFPDEVKQLVVDVGRVTRQTHDPSGEVPEPQRANVSALVDVVQETIGEGQYEVLVQFVGQTEGGMTLIVGLHVADGQKLSDVLAKILPDTVQKGDIAGIQLEAGEARGVRFMRIDQRTKDADHERKIGAFYGGKPSLFVGTEPQALWLLVGGGDALDDFAKVPTMTSRTTRGDSISSMLDVDIHLADWIGLMSMANGKRDREFTAAARAALKDPQRDELRLTVRPKPDGLQISLSLDEAYLNMISSAVCKE